MSDSPINFLDKSGLTSLWAKIKNLVSGKSEKVAIVEHGTSDTTLELSPNVLHRWGTVESLTLTLGTAEAGYAAEYMVEFVSGSTPTSLHLPATVKFDDKIELDANNQLTIEANKIYQLSIEHNVALLVSVDNA